MNDKTRKDIGNQLDDPRKSSGVPTGNSGSTKENVKKEIERITQKGPLTQRDIVELQKRFPDEDSFDEIIKSLNKKYKEIHRRTKELASKIYKKYHHSGRPFHEILEKMIRYKKTNRMSDYEYDEVRKELSNLITGNSRGNSDETQPLYINRSRISRALGNNELVVAEGKLNIKESEYVTVNEILSMRAKYDALHKTVFMQTLMYEDCSLVAISGDFKRDKHNPSIHIHPVIACMFLPKLEIFDTQMLLSNFGNVLFARYHGKPFENEPDSLLFYAISTDRNDIVCEVNSPIADIKNRYIVQEKLWRTVLSLRNGNYYDVEPINDFMSSLGLCRNNLYDNADLIYNNDDGSILRKLLSVFSLRPTLITTKPLSSLAPLAMLQAQIPGENNFKINFGYGMGLPGMDDPSIAPFLNQPSYTITHVPMITVHLPPYVEGAQPKNLRDAAANQTIWINENKTLVPKEQSVLHSKEVLIFYVNRRVQSVQIRTFTNPLQFSQMPLTMTNFEKLNNYPLNVPITLNLGRSGEMYQLRSVVASTETEIRQGERATKIITGSTGLIMRHRDFTRGVYQSDYLLYDPFGASLPVKHPRMAEGGEFDGYFMNKPISMIEPVFTPENQLLGANNPSFIERASRNGTIFIYAKPTGYNPREIIAI